MPKSFARVLLVEDDGHVRRSTADWLVDTGYQVTTAANAPQAERWLRQQAFDVVVCDLHLGEDCGFAVLAAARAIRPEVPVVLLTGFATVATSIRALREGAADLVTKPFSDDELLDAMQRAIARGADCGRRPSQPRAARQGRRVIGHSRAMQQVLETLARVADADCPVLITGESGTGKSLLARVLHAQSHRASGPMVEVTCGALPDGLLESELFGHTTGAFTGAVGARPGRFLQADGGTIFLDEIATAGPALQVKLLRVLQDYEFEPVGGSSTQRVDCRVVLATNERLEQLVADGRFREDLYYRIHVINVELPPLRARREDLPLLIADFLAQLTGTPDDDRLSPAAWEALMAYDWPGNIRELHNVLERAWLLKRGTRIDTVDLPPAVVSGGHTPTAASELKQALADPERRIILDTLQRLDWNRLQAAQALGINRTTLYKKMKRLGLELPQRT